MRIRSWHLLFALVSVGGLAQSNSANLLNQPVDPDSATEAVVPAWEALNPDLLTGSTTQTQQSHVAAMKALDVVCGHSANCAPPQGSDDDESPQVDPHSVQ